MRPHTLNIRVRIEAEFKEMPGLKLTLAQAARFFNLERAECEQILGELVRAGELTTDGRSFQLPGTCARGA
jgi:hypothetical protein